MVKISMLTQKNIIETKINLFVEMKKSAVASMIAIAVSKEFLLHHIMHTKIRPKNMLIPPEI
jgi:hypothetical protein